MCQADIFLGENIEESQLCCGKEAKNLTLLSSGVTTGRMETRMRIKLFPFFFPQNILMPCQVIVNEK